jgi:hypothetical protein
VILRLLIFRQLKPGGYGLLRHEALCCIPDVVGRNLEGCFWV